MENIQVIIWTIFLDSEFKHLCTAGDHLFPWYFRFIFIVWFFVIILEQFYKYKYNILRSEIFKKRFGYLSDLYFIYASLLKPFRLYFKSCSILTLTNYSRSRFRILNKSQFFVKMFWKKFKDLLSDFLSLFKNNFISKDLKKRKGL